MDLRIGVSGAKFDAEVDFEVQFVPASQKLDKKCEKLISGTSNNQIFSLCFFDVLGVAKHRRRLEF